MKQLVQIILTILFFVSIKTFSQDKLFFTNGTYLKCKIIAISENTITYRDTIDESPLMTVLKRDVLIAEYKSGAVYIFDKRKNEDTLKSPDEVIAEIEENELKDWKKEEETLSNSILGFYIPSLVLGRLTVSYEKLFAKKSMGITIPLSLTYDPFVAINTTSSSSSTNTNSSSSSNSNNNREPTRGVGFITGVDVNYYYDIKPQVKYYFGPRIRYGTDMILGGIEGLTIQLQNGIFKSDGKHLTNTLGFGVGFFKLSAKYANYPGYEPRQVYPWMSFTWRIGFRL